MVKRVAGKKPQVTYVLRSNKASMVSHSGFVWPESGPVECPDWKPEARCGNGLHGLLMGEGDSSLLTWDDDAKWLVVAVDPAEVVKIDAAKVKFPRGEVVFCGGMKGAAAFIVSKGADPGKVPGSTATAGYAGTATAGTRGTATAGDSGTATAGYAGTATAGDSGTVEAGEDGVLVLLRWNGKRYKLCVAEVGENGIKPRTPYRLDKEGRFVEVARPASGGEG